MSATAAMTRFVAHLRLNGARIGPRETETALQALGCIDAADPDAARLALKSVLASERGLWDRFDALFEAFWFARGRQRAGAPSPTQTPDRRHVRPQIWNAVLAPSEAASRGAPEEADADDDQPSEQGGEGRLIASKTLNLRRTDLREFSTPAQLALAERVAEDLARALRDRLSRRRACAPTGPQLDLRRVIRRSLARGGDPLDLVWRRRIERPVRVVALLDVSGSMQVYARVFLSFLKGLIGRWLHADGYLFHTRLVRITDALRDHDTLRALGRLSLMAEGFGGGTKIASSLRAFNDRYARSAIDGRTVVLILSDGYDTDEPAHLAAELARLRKRARRIVWLNPLLGWRDYAPVARGMAAALPHLDAFRVANTLDALAALEADFARL